MEYNFQIDNEYVAVLLIEINYQNVLVTKQTYINARKRLNLHITQTVCL